MRRNLSIVFLIALSQLLHGQSGTYTVSKAFFSSERYDEFSPVFFGKGIVFCSNRSIGMSNYSTSENKGLFKIFFADSTVKRDWESSKYFSKNLNTILNDGPVTFNKTQDTVYFSRNQDVTSKLSEISSPRNKLGIYYAVLLDGQWTKIRELRINNEWYNVTTPCLSPDGKKLFFASDKTGGYGGTDLYYSLWRGDRWENPINLGPVINSSGNESYPFVNSEGELFFASDGHAGLGGKDIFFSMFADSAWMDPVHLDPPVNSKSDEFGIVGDRLMSRGYFSSNRDRSVDIFSFSTKSPQVFYDIIQKENQFCFTLQDDGAIEIDTVNLKYMWNFGDGERAQGNRVVHCFPGPGNYTVRLDIFDIRTNRLFFSKLIYQVQLKAFEQPFINSPDTVIKGIPVNFDGQNSNIPGFQILSYSWNFRDGDKGKGEKISHTFKKNGDFRVNMELVVKSNSTGEIHKTGTSKFVKVLNDNSERVSMANKVTSSPVPDIRNYENSETRVLFSAENDFSKDEVYHVELVSSKVKIGTRNALFKNIPGKYIITEKFNPADSTFSYIVDQQMNLMSTYPAYSELYALGYKNVRVKTFVLTDPSEKELHNLIRINGAYADSYFDATDKLTSNAYIMLDQIVKLLNKYPAIKLEVAVHSDNTGSAPTSQALSQSRAQLLVTYMINRGINTRRLRATGFGSSKPIASNNTDRERRLNRRIDFIIIP